MRGDRCLVHAIFKCDTCGQVWEEYKTAQLNARRHAKKRGHKVMGEVGFSVEYDGRSNERKNAQS